MNRHIRLGLLPIALAMAVSLRADDKAAPAAAPAQDDSVRLDNKQLTDELASSWKESDKLKADLAAAQAAAAKSASDNADLQRQLDAAKAQPPAPAAAPVPDTDAAKDLADVQDKLAMSLRSFSVIQDENGQLQATIDKLTADNASLSQQLDAAHSSIAALQVQAAATSQIDPLRTELRQSQDEAGRLAMENSQLRTHVALQSPGPGSARPMPLRPGTPDALAASTPVPAPEAAPAAPAAEKTYVVAEGDTLTKISRKFYGTSGRWEDILKANHDTLKDEKSLSVGSTIKIP
jgi:nucleoid-associated protein YgaU